MRAGQQVVLADLDEPLPGSATSSTNGTSTNTQNQPGGFRFGGAFPGGGSRAASGVPEAVRADDRTYRSDHDPTSHEGALDG